MNKEEDLLRNLRRMIKEQGIESFHLLEEYVPMEDQMLFFYKSEESKREFETFDKDEEIVILFSPNQTDKRKKESLVRLSSIPDVEAYRAIETFHSSPQEEELHNWSIMALLSSKIILSSTLSGQQQVYISSGLGGLDKRLRFFGLFSSNNSQPFTELQHEMIDREFNFQMAQNSITIEKFDIKENYFTMLILFPIDQDARIAINSTIEEINKYGNFLDTKYLFTNVREFSDHDIKMYLDKRKKKDLESEE